MNTHDVIDLASSHLKKMAGYNFDIINISEPNSFQMAVNLSKIISKLSPFVGNLIEYNTVEFLNNNAAFSGFGTWRRQDPGFPDTIFDGDISPTPGFEIKAWFPLATEITARFKDSQNHFLEDQTYVCMLAWLPEYLIYGQPIIIDVLIVSAASVAKARDDHYHNPPDYLVIEPEDTSARTSNLQQTNTNGYKFQKEKGGFEDASRLVQSWGPEAKAYMPTPEYQDKIRELIKRYSYRLDTNFAKMDRIEHAGIEEFKAKIYSKPHMGMTIEEWNKLLSKGDENKIAKALKEHLKIK